MINNKAFTLVELSIVMVIIGLMVSGVLAGQSLIQSAKRQAVVKEWNQYTVAYNAFKLEYNAIPGDFDEAKDYFGTDVANGNGNKFINGYSEGYYFWEHLSKAEIISGEYIGVASCGGDGIIDIGIDAPGSDYLNVAAWVPFSYTYQNHGLPNTVDTSQKNWLYIGSHDACDSTWVNSYFKCSDMYKIDKKHDDGKPFTGYIRQVLSVCDDGGSDSSLEYNVGSSLKSIMKFLLE